MKTYLRHRSLNVIDVKGLVALEYLDFEGKYKDYEETHDFCELCFVEHGEIELICETESILLSNNEIVFIKPNTRHSYRSESGNQSRAFVLCFECPSHVLAPLSGIRFHSEEKDTYCMKRIIEECHGTFRMNDKGQLEVLPSPSFGGQQAIILQIECLLISLLRRKAEDKSSGIVFLRGERFYAELVDIIKGYLQSNVGKKISINDVCKRFSYSRSFVCKIFKEQTGESLITYFNRLKVEEAKRMLVETEMTVSEISETLGFSEAKYFGTVFKNQEGVSPMAYRESKKKLKED